MQRIPEKESMDDVKRAKAYNQAFFQSDMDYASDFASRYKNNLAYILDIGTGPAKVPVFILKDDAINLVDKIVAVDRSQAMIDIAKKNLRYANYYGLVYENQVTPVLMDFRKLHYRDKGTPERFTSIISNSLLHHLGDPNDLWKKVRELSPDGKETAVYMMDLIRPESVKEAKAIVERNAKNEHPFLKEDFYNSLLAAYTIPEVKEQLKKSGLNLEVKKFQYSDRHMLIEGIVR